MATPLTTATAFGTGVSTAEDSFQAGKEAAQKASEKMKVAPKFGITFVSSKYNYPDVLRGIKSVVPDAQLIGCSSAGEFTEDAVGTDSVVCAFITSSSHQFTTGLGKGIKTNPVAAIKESVAGFPKSVEGFPHSSAIILIDGLCGVGDEVCAAALSVLGPTVRFVGGAAGDDLKLTETNVFHGEQSHRDAAAVCQLSSKMPVAIGVKHGHCVLSEPLTLTKTSGSKVFEISGRPAFDVWKDCTRERAKKKGINVDELNSTSDIGSFLLQYEAGLLTTEGEYILRAPLSVNPDKSLNFVCSMTEGSEIRIMESPNRYYQIASAKQAAEIAKASAGGAKLAGAIIFDCVCRKAILDKEYFRGVEEIKNVIGNIPLIGFATYGEIAMGMRQMSGFHNTTTVVLLIPE
jgi:hypothetical protein